MPDDEKKLSPRDVIADEFWAWCGEGDTRRLRMLIARFCVDHAERHVHRENVATEISRELKKLKL